MSNTAIIVAKPVNAAAFKGRNSAVRNTALAGVASCAYAEGVARAALLDQLRITLGKTPSEADLKAAQLEYVVGRTAQRLAPADMPKGVESVAQRIAFARALLDYAAPVKDGTTARKLKRGQGRRSVSQHKAIRASESAWSLVKAELGYSNALTSKEKGAKARNKPAPQMAGSTDKGAKGKGATPPTHAQLVTPAKPADAAAAMQHIMTQAAALLAYCNKHAAIVPTAFGQSVTRFHGAIAQAMKEA